MYAFLRTIHLYTAMVLATFVVMYFVTGYVLTHHTWFGEPSPNTSTRAVTLPDQGPGLDSDEAAYAAWLQAQCGIGGKRQPARRQNDGRWTFRFHRPGHNATVVVESGLRAATVEEVRHDWRQTLIGFHRLHGYGGGRLYDLWAVLYDAASMSMILFALTGVWLWYKLIPNRRLGWAILAVGFAFVSGFTLFFLWAP